MPELQRSQARQAAAYASINASAGSAMWQSFAMIESAHNNKLSEYRAQLNIEAMKDRARLGVESIAHCIELIKVKVQEHRLAAQLRSDLAKANIVANSDYTSNQLQVDVEAERWNLGLLREAKHANLLSGSPTLDRGLSPWQAGLSMAFSAAGGLLNVAAAVGGK
jgi:hypothetical protein